MRRETQTPSRCGLHAGENHAVSTRSSTRAATRGIRMAIECATPGSRANGIKQAFSALLACFGGSQYGAIHALTATRPARGRCFERLTRSRL